MSQSSPNQRLLFVVFLLALLFNGNALSPKIDEDTWWHMAVGREIVQTHQVPSIDPFSRMAQEEQTPWAAYSWLHELVLYGAYSLAGFPGIIAFRHLLDSLTFITVLWCLFRHSDGRMPAILLAALVTVTLLPLTLERPWHYTIVFTVLTLHAVLQIWEGDSPWKYRWLVPIYILWANLHIQFVLGLGLLGLLPVCLIADRLLKRRMFSKSQFTKCIYLGIACTLATLVNPYHLHLYRVIWEYSTQTTTMSLIYELSAPDFSGVWHWSLVLLLLVALFTCIQRRFPTLETALIIAGCFFSLRMNRDIWVGSVFAAMATARMWAQPSQFRVPLGGLIGVTLAAALLLRLVALVIPNLYLDQAITKHYPAAAVQYVRETQPPGPLYNHLNWGGYLIWSLPEYRVDIDGRTNLYGEARIKKSLDTWYGRDDWEQDPDLARAGFIIAEKSPRLKKLTELMKEHPERWRVVFEDDTAAVFVPIKRD